MKFFSPICRKFESNVNNFNTYSILPSNKLYKLTNVSPGPAVISPNVLKKISEELSNEEILYGSTPLEMSHRSPEFKSILNNVNDKLRNLMEIPEDFSIIWTQGGGHGQFSAIPMNMNQCFENVFGCYIVSGTWSFRAYNESKKFIKTKNITENYYSTFNYNIEYNKLPSKFEIPKDASYLYLCSNETVNGIEFRNNGIQYPSREELGNTKLIVDMSSDFLMKKIKWDNIDMAFACTSKNMGIAGANVVILRNDILSNMKYNSNSAIPCILDWKLYADTYSLYNTPATFNFYVFDYILDNYIDEMKNINQIDEYNKLKANYLYDFLDNSKLYTTIVKDKNIRSNINIPFVVGDGSEKVRTEFLKHCYDHNLVGLRTQTPFSYDSLGLIEPLRISLYNGIKLEDVKRIIQVMDAF